ncbi:hypothetical protein AVEN_5523-1 [Araneus ventricosus]|uniref:Uncharacterized protein n=1 Tax=Araneus ventricosus TaxID=182803 RepID=A0A4Y2IW80_ARAVE|nr:hypothetical protein AVEN_5523-1 [Araneus ventricosus]
MRSGKQTELFADPTGCSQGRRSSEQCGPLALPADQTIATTAHVRHFCSCGVIRRLKIRTVFCVEPSVHMYSSSRLNLFDGQQRCSDRNRHPGQIPKLRPHFSHREKVLQSSKHETNIWRNLRSALRPKNAELHPPVCELKITLRWKGWNLLCVLHTKFVEFDRILDGIRVQEDCPSVCIRTL